MMTIDIRRLNLRPLDRVLDIGCGEGRHMVGVCRQTETRCVGGDAGYANLTATRDKLAVHQALSDLRCRSVSLAAMDITAMPLADESMDAVICAEVLEHIPEDGRAVAELVRVLKTGRILAVSVPRHLPEHICWRLSRDYSRAEGGHVRIYRKNELIGKISALGMRCIGGHHAHSLHTPFWWLKCLLGIHRPDVWPVRLYHRLLVWELMAHPPVLSAADRLLNPIFGKSLVIYFQKIG